MDSIDIVVPDIGDFTEVEVIEVFIGCGQRVDQEDTLITLETDKATLDVPAPHAGVITEVVVAVSSHVSEGSLIARIETDAAEQPTPAQSAASSPVEESDPEYDVVVLGSGPGGYAAAFRSADLGLKTALIERYPDLGGVCLNVGCIPSKALLHVASISEQAQALTHCGLRFDTPQLDLDRLRAWKNEVIGKLTDGLSGMARQRQVTILHGVAHFQGNRHLRIEPTSKNRDSTETTAQIVRFGKAIIATGSEAIQLPFLPDDPRVVDSAGALKLDQVPERMLVIGGGIIGLEMATVYSALGARIDLVETLDNLMAGADSDLVAVWQKTNAHRFDHIMRRTRAVSARADAQGVWVTFDGDEAPDDAQRYDLVLQSVGRRPNGATIGAHNAGVVVSELDFIPTDTQMRSNVAHIFAIGDVAKAPMLAHKAVHEGHVAAEAAAGQNSHFDARVIPSVAYTDPEVAWVGVTETQAAENGHAIETAKFPWAASGRAIANACEQGFTKLLFDAETGRIVGGAIVGPGAGDLIGEIGLAIEMGADAEDIGKTIHPHPTFTETIGMAAELYAGVCTDLPPNTQARNQKL